jgi:hypothetical protein
LHLLQLRGKGAQFLIDISAVVTSKPNLLLDCACAIYHFCSSGGNAPHKVFALKDLRQLPAVESRNLSH